ncbi:hypothetical protein QOT17_015176 [Balamuthia mandrillaris]
MEWSRNVCMNDQSASLQLLASLRGKDPMQAAILRQVYLDLIMVKQWQYVELRESPSLNLCYLIGRVAPPNDEPQPQPLERASLHAEKEEPAPEEEGCSSSSPLEVVIPVAAHQPLSFNVMLRLLSELGHPRRCSSEGAEQQPQQAQPEKEKEGKTRQTKWAQVTLGIVDSDSTLVYYRLSDGLFPPFCW